MQPTEYLRGNSSNDECEGLFKQYKTCLNVSGPWATGYEAASEQLLIKCIESAQGERYRHDAGGSTS